jgi:hypothetical protein
MELKQNYTGRGVRENGIMEICKLRMGSNSNYLQADWLSRWSGWRETTSTSTTTSLLKYSSVISIIFIKV